MSNGVERKHVYLRDRMEKWDGWLMGGVDAIGLVELIAKVPVLAVLQLAKLVTGVRGADSKVERK